MFTFIKHFNEIFKFLDILIDIYMNYIVYFIKRFKPETFNDIVLLINDSTIKVENDFRAFFFNRLIIQRYRILNNIFTFTVDQETLNIHIAISKKRLIVNNNEFNIIKI